MPPDADPAAPASRTGRRRWLALAVYWLLLTALTALGLALLGERLFELDFSL